MDLEKFPESAAAQRMLSYVTKGWYDESYVGKWIYEVMGREVDLAEQFYLELPDQFFVDTETWGLRYHEIKYGLPVREDLPYEERRARIIEKRESKYSMTPYRMEVILGSYANCDVTVRDINEEGCEPAHPNIFEVEVSDDRALNMDAVWKKLKQIKLSHTTCMLSVSTHVCVTISPSFASAKVPYVFCGTLPDVSIAASIVGTQISLINIPLSAKAAYLRPGEADTGLHPMLSVMAGIDGAVVEVADSAEGCKSQHSISGERDTGTIPGIQIGAGTGAAQVEIERGEESAKSAYTISGQTPVVSVSVEDLQALAEIAGGTESVRARYDAAGALPKDSIHPANSPGDMEMSVETGGYVAVYRMCGDDF